MMGQEAYVQRHMHIFEECSAFFGKPTYLRDPHDFYILPLMFKDLVLDLQTPGPQHSVEELKVNDHVVYYSEIANTHIRGKIKEISSDVRYLIKALDNGFEETGVDIERIFHPENEAALTIVPLARQCMLECCVPLKATFSDEAIETFKNLMGTDRLHMIVKGKSQDKLRVKAFGDKSDDVSTLLALRQLTSFGSFFTDDLPPIKHDWSHRPLREGDSFEVRVQYGGSLSGFYVSTLPDYRQYVAKRAAFTLYCRTQPAIQSYDFVRGRAIGVMETYGAPYERAIILDVISTAQKARVKLIDWGREFTTEIDKVKAVNSGEFTRSYCRAIFVAAPDAVTWPNGYPTFLHPGFKMIITINRLGREYDIPHLVTLEPCDDN